MERRDGARALAKRPLAGLAKPAARLARRANPLARGPGAARALHPQACASAQAWLRCALSAHRSRLAAGARH